MRAPGTSDIAGYRTYKNSALCQGRVENEPMRLAKCAAPQEDKAAREVLGGALTEAQKGLQISNMGSKDSKGIVIGERTILRGGGSLPWEPPQWSKQRMDSSGLDPDGTMVWCKRVRLWACSDEIASEWIRYGE